jgi:MOSC domain-containing protein YiiM
VGNPRVHGGPEKAIYAYGAGVYAGWIADHPEHAARLVPGAFGENLLIDGLDEGNVCIGDRWRIGSALVEVCQPRQPCATLARWFGDPRMVKAMVKNGRSGWYLRVREEGLMAAGDALTLEHRPDGAWTLARVLEASYRSPPDQAELGALARAEGLASSWAAWAASMAEADKPRAKPI